METPPPLHLRDAKLGDWLRNKFISLLQTLVQSELNSSEEWAGLPSLGFCH